MDRLEEISVKLALMRSVLQETESKGIRLRSSDWFAWATAGGSSTVLLAAETGVAEVLVTTTEAWILTDEIEAQRLQDEQLPALNAADPLFKFFVNPWAESSKRETFVQEVTQGGTLLSDRPSFNAGDRIAQTEFPLPQSLIYQRQILMHSELERYRQVGKRASEAMTDVLSRAQPNWTEYQLAGAGAEALWTRGLHPVLTLASGDRRLPLYRHPLPSAEPIGRQAMLVFCARGHGLVISLTRFVCFGKLSKPEKALHNTIAEIEAVALEHSKVGTSLNAVYQALANTYSLHGYPNAIYQHHQGGTAGYGAREIIATPETNSRLTANMALAWNPSIPGSKIEDTFFLNADNSLENLSFDPTFPHREVAAQLRPLPLER